MFLQKLQYRLALPNASHARQNDNDLFFFWARSKDAALKLRGNICVTTVVASRLTRESPWLLV